uniref:Uncharacterized protein n=1 Tax=Arundo donax TaxID=35708 RepID=A0A0A9CHI3_ARUDO
MNSAAFPLSAARRPLGFDSDERLQNLSQTRALFLLRP